jgi:hypothetical protein
LPYYPNECSIYDNLSAMLGWPTVHVRETYENSGLPK